MKRYLILGNGTAGTTAAEYIRKHDDAGEIWVENRFESRIKETDAVYRKIVIENNRIIGCIMLGDISEFNSITKVITKRSDIAPG